MENNCPSEREELNSETSTIHKSILCLEVSVQTDSHLWMDLFQVRRQVVWAARLQESLSWLVYCPPQLTLILLLRFFNEKTVDVYKKTQQGNLLGPHGGGGVVGYRNPFYGIRPARPAFCLVTFAKEPRTRKRRNGFMWISHSKRSICDFDKDPQLSIHSHYCDSDMKFSFWAWRVICEVEPHKGRGWFERSNTISCQRTWEETELGKMWEEICLLS